MKEKTEKNALTRLFNYELNQYSPLKDDYARVVKYDEDGNEFVTYEKIDYSKIQRSLGSVSDWSLEALLKAGINPDFPIHTSAGTNLEGLNSITDWNAAADSILAEPTPENN